VLLATVHHRLVTSASSHFVSFFGLLAVPPSDISSVTVCLAVKTARLDAANEAGRSRRSKSSTQGSVELPQPSHRQLTAEQLEQRRERVSVM